jgi:hypothetical protein
MPSHTGTGKHPDQNRTVAFAWQVLSAANLPFRTSGLMHVVGFTTMGHAISAACKTLPINLDTDSAAHPVANATENLKACREQIVCRCKVLGVCPPGMTTAPTTGYPRHEPNYYCLKFGLCYFLPAHLRPEQHFKKLAEGREKKCLDAEGNPEWCSAPGAAPNPEWGDLALGFARSVHGRDPLLQRRRYRQQTSEEGRIPPTYDAEGDLTNIAALSRVIKGADERGKMFVRKVEGDCDPFLLELLRERIQGSPPIMAGQSCGEVPKGVIVNGQPTLLPDTPNGEPPTISRWWSVPEPYKLTRALWRHYCSISGQDGQS